MLTAVRAFFAQRGVMEVDCPTLSLCGSLDAHIDLVAADVCGLRHYLHSSPEYLMKRLLAEGIGDIYQLGHVYRDSEVGVLHQPEFTLIEWYRVGVSLEAMIRETIECIHVFLGSQELEQITYREAFLRDVGLDPFTASEAALLEVCEPYAGWELEGRDALLHLILSERVEPNLGRRGLTVLHDYPASQAALAQSNGLTAARFEVYCQGVELANGYHELSDADEQRQRFEEANHLRAELGKATLPIDQHFLSALEHLPDCCGVAVGFDRLLMLRLGAECITDVLPFSLAV